MCCYFNAGSMSESDLIETIAYTDSTFGITASLYLWSAVVFGLLGVVYLL